jgi:hypothetical protein
VRLDLTKHNRNRFAERIKKARGEVDSGEESDDSEGDEGGGKKGSGTESSDSEGSDDEDEEVDVEKEVEPEGRGRPEDLNIIEESGMEDKEQRWKEIREM